MIAYVVMGTTGEYSDRKEWPVCWFEDKAMAELYVTRAERFAKSYQTQRPDRFQADCKNPFDQNFDMDYTGTDYYVMEVPKEIGVPEERLFEPEASK